MTSPTRESRLPGPETVTRVVLDNGITVLVYENYAAQSVVLAGSMRSGSLFEDASRSGLAALTAAALMRGTETRDFDAINTALEENGADLNISAGVHRTSFFGKSLAEDLPILMDILADALRRPTFPAAHVERLRGEIITGLQIRQNDTRYRANRAFHETLYPAEHPYSRSVRGTLQTVPALTLDDIRAFHRRTYGPQGMIVVIVGAVNAEQAVEIAQARLADWRNDDAPESPALPDVPRPETTRRANVTLAGKTQTDIVMGLPGPPRRSPDYLAANLANSVLGQFGMMGRIGATVREELGLAYYAGSHLEGGHGPGPWIVTAGVNPVNVELAIERITDEIRRITREPVSEDELSDNQSYFIGHLPLQLESNEGIAATLVNIETFDLGLDYLLNYRARISALTSEDLLVAARRYLNPDALVIAMAGPDQP